jgi:hypothetical protein
MSLTGFISYKRVGWTGQTPWNPTNLNIMDKGIKDNNDMIANLRSEVSALNSNKVLTILEYGFLADYQIAERELGNGIYLYFNSHINNFQISVISISNNLKTCNIYTIYEDLINTANTTKITYNKESGKVKFDSSTSSCRGNLFKFNERIPNT